MKNNPWSESDIHFMQRAIELAERGRGAVSPNPLVGAVLVKNQVIIGEGYHHGFGLPHAEKEALLCAQKGGYSVKGATLFITLEPCCHTSSSKKTPPCSPLLIESGIKRIICALQDPNPLVSGRGIRQLKRAGIVVEIGCLESMATELNIGYISCIEKKRPFVVVKIASSIDGRIATKTGESQWITSDTSRKSVYTLRDHFDAILVGKGTILADNPHIRGLKTEPLRVILDSELKTSLTAHVYESPKAIVYTTPKAPVSKIEAFKRGGVDVIVLPELKLKRVVKELLSRGIMSLFIEGGSEIFGSAFDEDIVDRVYWYFAPVVIGGKNALSAVNGEGVRRLKNAKQYVWKTCEQIGPDLLMILERRVPGDQSA